uniref:Ethylmalonyl-CoA decarboxylase n=1 Tax=Canis lupus familiaris TaxID=9615 RepID=A0A8C0MRM8_CANLF
MEPRPEMAGNLLKTSSLSVRTKLLHQTGLSLYNTSHGFHEEDLKKKLQQFPGGSVDLQKEDSGIGILTLNNPSKMNAFSGVMMLQLLEKVIELENWTEGKGLIVRGAKNTFSSGSDLNAVKALATPEDGMALCMFMQNTLTRLMRLPLISVALIQGRALGGGAEVTTACDFRLMTADGEIRFVHREMGIVPSWGGGTRLVELLGARQALKVLSGALPLDAARALSLGMVEEVLRASDEASCLQEARAWLGQFTQGPPQVIRALKRSHSCLSQKKIIFTSSQIACSILSSTAGSFCAAKEIISSTSIDFKINKVSQLCMILSFNEIQWQIFNLKNDKTSRQGYLLSPLLFHTVLELLAEVIRLEKDMKGIQKGNEEVELSLFAEIVKLSLFSIKSKEPLRKLLELVNKFSTVVGYKFNVQVRRVSVSSSQQLKKEIKKPF